MLRYGCHAGHTFAADTVLSAQADEKLLEMLQRSHQERAALARRLVPAWPGGQPE
jgi:hypothetical protein